MNASDEKTSLAEKTLLHYYRYRKIPPGIELEAPWALTQGGVADGLGISRSHAAILTNRLEDEGKLVSGWAHIKELTRNSRYKVYWITASGIAECEEILKNQKTAEEGAPAEEDINFCATADFWMLPERERTEIGCLMVLRTPVYRDDFGGRPPKLIRFDEKDRVDIRPEVRRKYIAQTDIPTLNEWHEAAAEWCEIHGLDPREQLYHLQRTGRQRTAAAFAMKKKFVLMDFPTPEARDIVESLGVRTDNDELVLVSARMSLKLGDVEKANDELKKVGPDAIEEAAPVWAETTLATGKREAALEMAVVGYGGDAMSALTLAICLEANGRHEEALKYLDTSRSEMRRTGCLFRMDELLECRKKALIGMGDLESAEMTRRAAEWWTLPTEDEASGEHRKIRPRGRIFGHPAGGFKPAAPIPGT